MKKFLTILVLFFLSFTFLSFVQADTGTVNYDLTFIENYGYDLANGGTFQSMPGYSCTGRTKIIGNSLKVNTIHAQYILFWNSSAGFLGYDIIDSNGGLIYLNSYLGDGVYNESFVKPYGAFTFALMCDNLAENGLSGLGAYTYQDIFGNPSYLNYTDSVIGGSSPTGTLADLGSYSTLYYDDVLTVSLQDAFNNPSYTDFITEYNGMTLEDIFYRSGTPSSAQILENDSFTDNVNNWSTTGGKSTNTWTTGGLIETKKTASGMLFYTSQSFNYATVGHIFLVDAEIKSESAEINYLGIGANGASSFDASVTNPVVSQWYRVTDTFTCTGSLDILFKGTNSALYNNTLNLKMYADYIRLYDLTIIFGSGNEPSVEQFKEYLSTDSYNTFRTIQNIGYSGDDLDDAQTMFTNRSIPVLTLTNLIQNGQFTNDVTGWLTDFTRTWENGHAKITQSSPNALTDIYKQITTISGNYIYLQYSFNTNSDGYERVKGNTLTGGSENIFYYTQYSSANVWNIVSGIGLNTIGGSNEVVAFVLESTNGTLQTITYFDDISMFQFSSNIYTKTQIDNALVNFGYLTYNVTYYLPDMSASGTGERSFGTCGDDVCYAVDGSGIGTDLEIYDYYTMYLNGYFNTLSGGNATDQVQEWRSVYGDRSLAYPDTITGINPSLLPLSVQTDFTADHTARDYYIQLYYDAVNEVDRWEWYSTYGVTAENYSYYAQLFVDANEPNTRWEWWKDDGITASNYDYYINPLLTHTLYLDAVNEVDRYEWYIQYGVTSSNYASLLSTYEELLTFTEIPFNTFNDSILYWEYTYSTEPEETVAEKIINWLTEINPFWVIVFAFGVMGVIAIILMFAHAPFISYIIFETLIFVLFAIVGFFASWFIIIATALMYIAILLLAKRKLGGM